jgi:hypothetical protein
MARREQEKQPSYWWLKILVFVIVAGAIYCFITNQILLLIECLGTIVAGFIIFFVIRSWLENRSYRYTESLPKQTVIKQQRQEATNGLDLSKVKTDDLIKILTERGQVK